MGEEEVVRCSSCEHGEEYHDVNGRCWFTPTSAVYEVNSVCQCQIREIEDE
jgi:hypothetical protein